MRAFVGVEKERSAIEIPASLVHPMVVELKLLLRIDLYVICDMNGATLWKDRFPGVGIDALSMKILLPSGDLDVLNETSVSLRARVAGK